MGRGREWLWCTKVLFWIVSYESRLGLDSMDRDGERVEAREGKGRGGKGRGGEGRKGKGRERKGREGKGREGEVREEKGR